MSATIILDCLQSVSFSFLYRNNTRKEHTGHEIYERETDCKQSIQLVAHLSFARQFSDHPFPHPFVRFPHLAPPHRPE